MATVIITAGTRTITIDGDEDARLRRFVRRIWPGRVRKVHKGRYVVMEGEEAEGRIVIERDETGLTRYVQEVGG